jgi:hypothetical protein
MSRKHDEPVVSRHLELYETDWDFLQQHFGRQSEAKLGVSVAIRQMIRKGVRDYQERIARRLDRLRPEAKPLPALDKFFKSDSGSDSGSSTNDL